MNCFFNSFRLNVSSYIIKITLLCLLSESIILFPITCYTLNFFISILQKYLTIENYNYAIDYFMLLPFAIYILVYIIIGFIYLPQICSNKKIYERIAQVLHNQKYYLFSVIIFFSCLFSIIISVNLFHTLNPIYLLFVFLFIFPYKFIFIYLYLNYKRRNNKKFQIISRINIKLKQILYSIQNKINSLYKYNAIIFILINLLCFGLFFNSYIHEVWHSLDISNRINDCTIRDNVAFFFICLYLCYQILRYTLIPFYIRYLLKSKYLTYKQSKKYLLYAILLSISIDTIYILFFKNFKLFVYYSFISLTPIYILTLLLNIFYKQKNINEINFTINNKNIYHWLLAYYSLLGFISFILIKNIPI